MKPVAMIEDFEPPRPNRRPAVSLVYDGGHPSHLEIAAPALTSRELSGTFFSPSIELIERLPDWQAIANEGHEIGSHSLFGFTDERGNLPNWTLDMVEEDLRMSRKLLTESFGSQTDFAFAFPGDSAECVSSAFNPQPTDYFQVVDRLFRVSRTLQAGTNPHVDLNPLRLRSIDAFGMKYDEWVDLVERATSEGSWIILNFQGIGSGDCAVNVREHELFLDFLAFHKRSVDVATVCRHATLVVTSSAFSLET